MVLKCGLLPRGMWTFTKRNIDKMKKQRSIERPHMVVKDRYTNIRQGTEVMDITTDDWQDLNGVG